MYYYPCGVLRYPVSLNVVMFHHKDYMLATAPSPCPGDITGSCASSVCEDDESSHFTLYALRVRRCAGPLRKRSGRLSALTGSAHNYQTAQTLGSWHHHNAHN